MTFHPQIMPSRSMKAQSLSRRLKGFDEIQPVTDCLYLLKGWLMRGGSSVVYGASNVGKTVFALDLSLHIAGRLGWHGHRVDGGPVMYLAAEGGNGINNRIEANRRYKPDLALAVQSFGGFHLLASHIDLCGDDDATAIAELCEDHCPEPALIVIDTLARSMGSGDENTAKDMGQVVRNADRIRYRTGAHVMFIHHSGKDATKGARGSNSLRAAVDTEIELSRSGDVVTAEATKQRDMATGAAFSFNIRGVKVGDDQDGEPVFAAVLEQTDAQPRKPIVQGQPKVALQALSSALAKHGKPGNDPVNLPSCPVVSMADWRTECDLQCLSDSDDPEAKRKAFHRARGKLQEKGLVRVYGDYAWPTHSERDKPGQGGTCPDVSQRA
ncbi:AAA family ATPase [Halovulum sp. GXIMD14794]